MRGAASTAAQIVASGRQGTRGAPNSSEHELVSFPFEPRSDGRHTDQHPSARWSINGGEKSDAFGGSDRVLSRPASHSPADPGIPSPHPSKFVNPCPL